MPDVVLIHPSGKKQVYQSLSQNLTAIEPPLWCGLIAEYVRRKGYSVTILDANAENLSPEETAQKAADLAPRLAAVVVYGHQPSASTQHMPSAGAICRAIKEVNPDQKILMLGGHVAALPEQTLREESTDFVCSGEGPKTVEGLLEALQASSPDFASVPDLWYRVVIPAKAGIHGSPITHFGDDISKTVVPQYTFPAPLISHLDQEMPEPAWDLLPMDRYRAHNWHTFGFENRAPYASIYTTLGCPYHCTFCCIQAPFKSGEKAGGVASSVNSYRFWNPDSAIQTIDHLVKNYGVRHLKIADEMFILNEKHVNAICHKLVERDYGLNIWAYARVDTIKAEQLSLLKKAGFNWLALGIESASETVLRGVSKGYRTEIIGKTIRQIQEAGIHVIANYIFGLPEDSYETMQETLDLAVHLNTEFANFYCTMAYPGSALYSQALQEGWALPQNWGQYSQHAADAMPLATRHLSSREVLEFRDRAFQIYFSRPEYLAMMKEKFGQKTCQEIEAMLSVPFGRQSAGVRS